MTLVYDRSDLDVNDIMVGFQLQHPLLQAQVEFTAIFRLRVEVEVEMEAVLTSSTSPPQTTRYFQYVYIYIYIYVCLCVSLLHHKTH